MSRLFLLKTQAEFEAFRASKSFETTLVKIRVRQAVNQNIPRFGFIVPKKVLAKATDRNKLKRRLKSILQKFQGELVGVDVLIFPKAQTLKKTFGELQLELENLFSKARIWKS